jgi:hypothetical protein
LRFGEKWEQEELGISSSSFRAALRQHILRGGIDWVRVSAFGGMKFVEGRGVVGVKKRELLRGVAESLGAVGRVDI